MSTEFRRAASPQAVRAWEVTLDAELPPAAAAVTAERARTVAELLVHMPGIGAAVVRPHCQGRFLYASLVVEARDLQDAVDRGAVLLRDCATAAGVGPLILVAARHSCTA